MLDHLIRPTATLRPTVSLPLLWPLWVNLTLWRPTTRIKQSRRWVIGGRHLRITGAGLRAITRDAFQRSLPHTGAARQSGFGDWLNGADGPELLTPAPKIAFAVAGVQAPQQNWQRR